MSERLFRLLPTYLRMRDEQSGGALRALLGVMSDELDRVQENIEALYDNWFIETCDEWAVPYIGDLLGVGPQYVFDTRANSLRPFVANTLGFRRRKGTAAMLEDLGQSMTGWRTRAVELFQLLAATQHVNHLRLQSVRTPDLRDTDALELLGGPFERAGRLVEVRRVANRRGKYDIPHVALFVWRLDALEVDGAPATPDAAAGPGRFRFGQLGADLRLFNPARTIDLGARIAEADVPGPLRARAVYEELRTARRALSVGAAPRYRYFAAADPALRVRPVGEPEIPPEQIQICDLSGWTTLPPAESVPLPGGGKLTTRVAVDPVRGRLAFVSGATPAAVRVSYHHGFSARIGGGFYDRSEGFADTTGFTRYTVAVTNPALAADPAFSDAVAQWNADGRPKALFDFADSGVYAGADLVVPAGGRVELRARDHQRPVLRLGATWHLEIAADGAVAVNGLLIDGAGVEVLTSNAPGTSLEHHLSFDDCTLVPGLRLEGAGDALSPGGRSLTVATASTGRLELRLGKCIAGCIDLSGGAGFEGVLSAADAILDATGGADPAIDADRIALDRVTVLGSTRAVMLSASDAIFTGRVEVQRTQTGCARFSYVPPDSIAPRCYRCQPALALEEPGADAALVTARIKPAFTSTRYGDPGYAQLGALVPEEIRAGAAEGSEMGVFCSLRQLQRESNLRAGLDEYLKFGLEAGIFFVT